MRSFSKGLHTVYKEHHMSRPYSRSHPPRQHDPNEHLKRVYMGNVPYEARDEDVRRFFDPLEVTYVKLVVDRETGRAKGYGFVTFKDEKVAAEAATRDGGEMMGRTVIVRPARPRDPPSREQRRDAFWNDRD